MVNSSIDQPKTPRPLSALARLVQRGRIPSALIFHGERGIGKSAAARRLGQALLCTLSPALRVEEQSLGCGECHNCLVTAAGNHPDLHYLDLVDSETWTTAAFRSFLSSLSLKPFSGGSRVVIFDNAEAMSLQSANALLKSLEEPRPENHFILVSSAHLSLPQTILSRCQPFYFAPPGERGKTEQEEKEKGDALITAMAEGSLTMQQLFQDNIEICETVLNAVNATIKGGSAEAVLKARELSQKKSDIGLILTILQRYIRYRLLQSVAGSEGGTSEAQTFQRRLAQALSNALTAERLILERHLAAASVLTAVLDGIAADSLPPSWASNRELLLSSYTL